MSSLHYTGGDPSGAVEFFRAHRANLRALRRVLVDARGTTVKDINGEGMVLDGLVLGCPELEALLKMAGASYNPATLHEPPRGGEKEFEVVKHDPWGHDRVL